MLRVNIKDVRITVDYFEEIGRSLKHDSTDPIQTLDDCREAKRSLHAIDKRIRGRIRRVIDYLESLAQERFYQRGYGLG